MMGRVPILIFDGVDTAPMRYTQSEDEMQKSLLSSILETRTHLFFDDVKEFNNRALLQSITSRFIAGRLLGQTRTVERMNNFNWIATGNNPEVYDEMERRICWIRMNAQTDDIQKRTYRHANLPDWIKENRPALVHACLTLIQNWLNLGKPMFEERKRASFEDWSMKVGGVLMCAGITGFLDNRRTIAADMNAAAAKQFVREWFKRWGSQAVTPAELYQWAFDAEYDIISGNNDDQKKSRFQRTLPSMEGKSFRQDKGLFMIRSKPDSEDNVTYYLDEVIEEPALEPA